MFTVADELFRSCTVLAQTVLFCVRGIGKMSGPVIRTLRPEQKAMPPHPPQIPPTKRARIQQPLEQLAVVKVTSVPLWWVMVWAQLVRRRFFGIWGIGFTSGCGDGGVRVSSVCDS